MFSLTPTQLRARRLRGGLAGYSGRKSAGGGLLGGSLGGQGESPLGLDSWRHRRVAGSFSEPSVEPMGSFSEPSVEPTGSFSEPSVEPMGSFSEPSVEPTGSLAASSLAVVSRKQPMRLDGLDFGINPFAAIACEGAVDTPVEGCV